MNVNLFNLIGSRVTELIVIFLAVILILLLIFARSSIELGEERLWFIVYLFFVSVMVTTFESPYEKTSWIQSPASGVL